MGSRNTSALLVGAMVIAPAVAGSGLSIIDAFRTLDQLGSSPAKRHTAARFLADRADDHPLICVELARRLATAPGDPELSTVFLDESHYCSRTMDRTIALLRGTKDALWLYSYLTDDQLAREHDLVEDVLLNAGESESAQMAIMVLRGGLQQYADLVARAVIERSWKTDEWVEVFRSQKELWGGVFAEVLLGLEANGPSADRALAVLDTWFRVLESYYPELAPAYTDVMTRLRERMNTLSLPERSKDSEHPVPPENAIRVDAGEDSGAKGRD